MVHTGEFFVKLDINLDMELIKILEEIKVIKDKGIIIMLKKIPLKFGNEYRLYLFVDFIELLERAEIKADDIDEILEKINILVRAILKRCFDLELNRIDYRYDVEIVSENARKLLLKLLNKGLDRSNYMKKIDKYEGTVRYYAKSKSNNIYDKENERNHKGEEIKDYERNIMRFEAQVKKSHLRYKKYKSNISLELEEYFTFQKYKEYMEKMIIKTIFKGDFYNLYHAKKIINKSSIRNKYKDEVIEFLNNTSKKRSLSKTKEQYGRYKYDKYIGILEELKINPIIIPEKERVTYLSNPLRELINIFDNN